MKSLKSLYNKAQAIISKLVLTDVPFVYQPSQIALAAFMVADSEPTIEESINRCVHTRVIDDISSFERPY